MKKLINTIFLGSCLLASLLIEIYSLLVWKGDIFSSVVLGAVVLIIGYLFMDSIRSSLDQKTKNMRFYIDQILNGETEKWTAKHTELFNLQKASYTATKKSAELLNNRYNDVLLRIENLEKSNAFAMEQLIKLQKASLEGQKKALNLQINYSKDNTKKLIECLQGDETMKELADMILKMSAIMEINNELLKEQIGYNSDNETRNTGENLAEDYLTETPDLYDLQRAIEDEEEAMTPEADADNAVEMEQEQEQEQETIEAEPAKNMNQEIVPLYDDPNKSLSADEIANLFASYGQ